MKNINRLHILLIVVFISLGSCNTSELASLNDDPLRTSDMDWNYLFTTSVLEAGHQHEYRYIAAVIQHLSDLSSMDYGDKYFKYALGYYQNCYTGVLENLVEVIRKTGPDGEDPQMVNLYNASRVMKVFILQRCTDLYGDIPYFEANKAHEEGLFYPKYDHQRDIYFDMLNELSEAAQEFDSEYFNKSFRDQDLVYSGEIEKWKKFAYSLMLRLAMRISNVEPAIAQSYVNEAIQGGVFTSNSDNAWIPMDFGPSGRNQNKISVSLSPQYWDGVKLSKAFIDFLRDNDDPRLMVISSGIGHWGQDKITDPDLQWGLPNGNDAQTIKEYEGVTTDVYVDSTYSRVNELMLDFDDPYLFQTCAEVELLLAEAALKGWHSGDPDEHYNKGVRAAMQMYDIFDPSLVVSDAEVDDYLAAHSFDPDKGYEMIGTQYWAATFLNFHETWANWRRTDYPVLTPINWPGNVTNGTIPRRSIFNIEEVSDNQENYIEAIERMGGDLHTTRVWWDNGN
jgi:hypothetical protein